MLTVPGILFLLLLPIAGYVMLTRPFLGLLLLVATIPLENAFPVAEGVTGTRILGMGVAMAWLAGKVLRGESFRSLFSSGFFKVAALFLALVLASSLWAQSPSVTRVGFFQLVMLLLFSLIVIDLSTSWPRVRWLPRMLILGGVVAALVTVNQYLGGIGRAGGGLAGGVNSTATLLVTLLPFGGLMILYEERWRWKLLGLAYVLIAVAAVSVTFSRMNYLLMPIVLLAIVWHMIRARRGRVWFIVVAAGLAIVAVKQVPFDPVMERVNSIGPYLEQTVQARTPEAPTTTGRGYHLRVALAIFRDHPLFGVGYNHFGYYFLHTYQFQVPGAKKRWSSWRSPHSSHLGILADLGLVGLLIWISLLLIAFRNLLRARLSWAGIRNSRQGMIIRAVPYSFLLQALPYGMYTPNRKAKIFWLLLALTVAVMRLIATRGSAPGGLRKPASRSGSPHAREMAVSSADAT